MEKYKFKKGDRVLVLPDPEISLNEVRKYVGETGTVNQNDSHMPWVRFDDGEEWAYREEYLQLVNETEMNKATELKALKEQLQQMTEKVNAFEKSLQTDIWKDGHWFPRSGKAEHLYCAPPAYSTEQGFVFTTPQRCQAWIDYQKACVVVRDACKPYLTEDCRKAYIPHITPQGMIASDVSVGGVPQYLWVHGHEKALEIAEQCKAELLIIQNFKWEI